MTSKPGTVRPGGRTARNKDAVLAAARELLAENGSLVIADVAERAGVHMATIYRRWGSPEALALDVAVTDLNASSPLPATGDVEADLRAWATSIANGVSGPGGLAFLQAITSTVADSGPLRTRLLMEQRIEQMRRMIDAADLADVLTTDDLVDTVLAPLYFRAQFGQPLAGDKDTVDRVVGAAMAVIAARRAGR
jgi:AcrR family transcriptional regulator